MNLRARIGGIGGIAFAILTMAALVIGSPAGGNYKASDITSYVASGHRAGVFVAAYLAVLAAVGLVCLLASLRASAGAPGGDETTGSVFWGLGLAAAGAFAVGWSILLSMPLAYAFGGSTFSLPTAEIYAITQAGNIVVFGASGVLLGAALITLAAAGGTTLPPWMRWLTLAAGIIGLASIAFFPWFILLIWGLVAGIWLLASKAA